MPNAYANKVQVVRGGQTETLIDLTADTITASALMQGYTAHDASGAPITGTATGGSMVIRDEADSHGGTIRHITAGTVVTGTTSITENGSYDVAQYADAVVSVPAPAPSLQSKTATPTESQQTVTPDTGYDGLSSVSVGAISSTYVGSGITRRSSTDLTASGATVTVPSGYYAAQASKAVASGTAGTPTATKGTVSNHAVSVTPSVTNTAGYISGGTKTGTAVSVSASELVSGTLSITSSGTKDVTNYASASVAAGGATASATKGTVSNHSVTVTPSVTRTAGYVTAGSSNGTAVTVSASELASGNKEITENGSGIDVVGYSTVSVAVPSSGGNTITVFGNGNSTGCYVQLNNTGTKYYTDGDEIPFSDGDELYIFCSGKMGGATITVDGVSVASTYSGGTNYTLSLLNSDVSVGLSYDNDSDVAVAYPAISITQNGKHDVSDYAYANVNVLGGGREYETGTWEPSSNVQNSWISLSRTHSTPPTFYIICRQESEYDDGILDTMQQVTYVNYASLFGFPLYPSDAVQPYYGFWSLIYRASTATTFGSGYGSITYPYSDTGATSNKYSRFFANESQIRAYSNSSSRLWRTGCTYKWMAVW